MIAGIGIDLVSIPRTARMINKWGDRFLEKVFIDREIKAGLSRPGPEQEFAAWFGAKEAVMKALGSGMMAGVRFKDIEVKSLARTKPRIVLHGKAREIADEAGVCQVHLSLTHESDYAAASVVLFGKENPGQGET
jgi:holo-[acyl-carrier protein] synthase